MRSPCICWRPLWPPEAKGAVLTMHADLKTRILRPGALLVAPMMLMASLIALPTPAQAAPGDLTCTANGQSSVTINAGESVTLAASVEAVISPSEVAAVWIEDSNGPVFSNRNSQGSRGTQSVSGVVTPTATSAYTCKGYWPAPTLGTITTFNPEKSVQGVVQPAPSITCEVIS